jgi:hypothetical protein
MARKMAVRRPKKRGELALQFHCSLSVGVLEEKLAEARQEGYHHLMVVLSGKQIVFVRARSTDGAQCLIEMARRANGQQFLFGLDTTLSLDDQLPHLPTQFQLD